MKAKFIEVSPPSKKTIHIKLVDQEFLNFPLHFHELCELVLILESYGKRIVGNSVDNFDVGDLVLMGPNIPHIWRNDPLFQKQHADLRAKAIVIYFPEDFLLQLTDDELTISAMQQFINRAKRGLCFYGETLDSVTSKLKTIINKQSFTRILDFLFIIELMHKSSEYRYLASEGYEHTFNDQDAKRINDVYLYVMQNFQQNINLNTAAAIANITPNAFCRFFRRHTQKSFSRFVNEMRVGHACKLLMNKELSISEVCFQSGYQNLTNFNKFFKLFMHKSAGQYRKEMGLLSEAPTAS